MSYLYYLKNENGKRMGPFTVVELSKYNVHGDTWIWREGMKDWTTIYELPEADSLLSKMPPPDVQKSDGCGVSIFILIFGILGAIFIPVLWLLVACVVIYLISKIVNS